MTREGFSQPVRRVRTGRRTLAMVVSGVCVLGVCLWPDTTGGRSMPRPNRPCGPAGRKRRGQPQPPEPVEREAAPVAARLGPPAEASGTAVSRPGETPVPHIVAYVNGHHISREDLARECLRHHGKDVLETMVNRQLILQECQKQHVTITPADVDAEIARMAKQFGVPVDQWLKLLKQQRNITPDQYATDVIWPSLALRALAGERLSVSQEELLRAFESHYGPAVQARLIACSDRQKAEQVRALAAAHPENFGDLAKEKSEDSASASLKGLVQPIHQHSTFPEIEEVAFALANGQVSQVVAAGGQFVIIKREGLIAAQRRETGAGCRGHGGATSATTRCARWPTRSSNSCTNTPSWKTSSTIR